MYNAKIKEAIETKAERQNVGYYRDERGVKRWGVIP